MNDERKIPGYKEALAKMASRPEFKAYLKLLENEENRILVQSFKVHSNDPELVIKKSHLEGRLFQLKSEKNTFEWATKGLEVDNEPK